MMHHSQRAFAPKIALSPQHFLRGFVVFLIGLLWFAAQAAVADSFVTDPTFSTSPQFRQKAWPSRVTTAPSGKVYVTFVNGGSLSGVDNQRRGAVIRLNADGTLDPSFNVGIQFNSAWAVIEQANGQVLIGGVDSNESDDSGLPLYRVFRLNNNGARDISYQSPVFTGIPRSMTMQPDGKLLLWSQPSNANGGLDGLQRLNSNGSVDTSFVSPVLPNDGSSFFTNIVVDSQSRILVGGIFATIAGQPRPQIARLLSNGTLDPAFVPSGFVSVGQLRGIRIQTLGPNAGKIVIAGGPLRTTTGSQTACPTTNGTAGSNSCPLLRLNDDGSLDTSFVLVPRNSVGVISVRPRALGLLPNDQLLVVSSGVARFNADGSLDTTYNKPAFSLETFSMATLADGRVYVPLTAGSSVSSVALVPQVIRFAADGTVDSTFAAGTFQREVYPDDAAVLPDGRFLTWGRFDTVGTTSRIGAARFNPDGTLDNTYQTSGISNLLGVFSGSMLSDGRLLASISTGVDPVFSTFGVARFLANGSVDSSFALDPTVGTQTGGAFDVRAQPDGTALVWTINPNRLVAGSGVFFKRLTSSGPIDNTFGGLSGIDPMFGAVYRDGTNAITSITMGEFRFLGRQADGRMLVAATVPPYAQNGGTFNHTLLRLNADGSVDSTFTAPTIVWPAFQGFTTLVPNTPQTPLTSVGQPIFGVLPLSDGGVLVNGLFTSLGGLPARGIARLDSSGAVDTSFSIGSGAELLALPGRTARVDNLTVDQNGKIWVSGFFDTFGGVSARGLARLNPDGSVDGSFSTPLTSRSYAGATARVVFDRQNRPMVIGTFLPGVAGFPDAFHRLTLDRSLTLTASWNLVGNSTGTPLPVASIFGNPDYVSSVWKWNATAQKWAFYTPTMQDGGAAYAASNQYDHLTTINGGEGFWVNAGRSFTVQLPNQTGTPVTVSNFANQLTPPDRLPTGWSLISTSDNKTPSGFNRALSATPPAQEVVPININSLWAWDANASNWYFYAPSLDAAGTLSNYVTTQNLLPFGANTLSPTTGFWVSKP